MKKPRTPDRPMSPDQPEPPAPAGPDPERAAWEGAEAAHTAADAAWSQIGRRQEVPHGPLEGGLRERRAQRQKLVAQLITEHKSIRSQAEVQELLQQRGVLTTQSSISRDLRDLGVRRVKGVYVIKPSRSGGWSFDDIIELVEMVTRSGPYTTVIQTIPDTARLVARTLEEAGWDEVVGTVAGEDTIFVATRTEEDQNHLFERFKKYLSV
ncbi:MAG TPA: hypothetical protein VEW48_08355 [Thermoanaerobaculia bacterium]|nr:hypothetical protein [Thermoanaerobaculia bacterium]